MSDDPKPPMSAEEMAEHIYKDEEGDGFDLDLDRELTAWEAAIRADERRVVAVQIDHLRSEVLSLAEALLQASRMAAGSDDPQAPYCAERCMDLANESIRQHTTGATDVQ